jgi:glycosyltransferase involved in cell wall biosynthesis
VHLLDLDPVIARYARTVVRRAVRRLIRLPQAVAVNRSIHAALAGELPFRPDLVVLFKAIDIFPATLEAIRQATGAVVVDWHPDDYFYPLLTSRHALACIPTYDCIFTVERFNVPELQDRGARRVEYLPLGFDPDIHHPVAVADADRSRYECDVVFVGSWRKDRAETLESLVAPKIPFSLKIWGNTWERLARRSPLRRYVQFQEATGEAMLKALCAARIALAFVTRFGPGRMVHTVRTFEIPACGAFMLAERASGQYLEFFEEDKEIACFGDPRELREKIEYSLAHPDRRAEIASAGRARLLRSGYALADRMLQMLDVVHEIREGRSR